MWPGLATVIDDTDIVSFTIGPGVSMSPGVIIPCLQMVIITPDTEPKECKEIWSSPLGLLKNDSHSLKKLHST